MTLHPAQSDAIPQTIDSMVFGATGFIGRWLLLELLGQGRVVAAAVRGGAGSAARLRDWLREHGADDGALTTIDTDLSRERLARAADEEILGSVRDVFNVAGRYQFGMAPDEARRANVDGALNVLGWGAGLPRLRRLVHLSGYRVSVPEARYPWSANESRERYRRLGAYEASKVEADAALRVVAAREAVPLTLVNPSTVVGHSVTGEAEQYIGLATTVRDLWNGGLPALAGSRRTFVPVVTVDYLARFMAAVPLHDEGPLTAHWVLDGATPDFPDLVAELVTHLGVSAPRRIVPVGLVRRLPKALTRVEPETLSFLSEDRYDTASADRIAAAAGLSQPPVGDVLRRWADRLVADRFGAAPSPVPGGFHLVAGGRTYLAGERSAPRFVLLHGLPLDGESWQGLLSHLDGAALRADLPGLGRSSPTTATAAQWLTELLSPVRTRPTLVAHSAAAGAALSYANAHPDRVSRLVLVSPYFLQRRPSRLLRTVMVGTTMLRHATAGQLTNSLLGEHLDVAPAATAVSGQDAAHQAIASVAANLRRPGVARRTARWLRDAQREAERSRLRHLLRSCPVPVQLIVGDRDPLVEGNDEHDVATIPDAGHHPHLSHPAQLGAAINARANESAGRARPTPSGARD
ncbi:alpha/beta fold hydrolase [Cryptosporangium minutisporangium]|uniref:Alpha/beta fold hydrolase n=1 Tax=Cryptosporangium minutisporangium TaxID=113569 RepID=A0ABP6SPK1_9ACTN